ncbi:MAG: TIR domain-containing protein, partial [Opitutus sp.]
MSPTGNKAVFLSYASQDAEAAKRICEALHAAGVEVWFDQSELVGGDAWDQKIRKQIRDCALMIPIISAATQARTEGYFRLEWRLADQRTHLMAKGRPFLLPVVIDDTRDADAQVPDSFTEVQWTRLPGGETPPKFLERVKKLVGGGPEVEPGRPRPGTETRGEVAAPPKNSSRRWLIPVVTGLAAAGGLALWAPWRKPALPAPVVVTAAALTPAQALVAKARTILEQGDELNRETYALAEELLVKAEALDVTAASAWALHATVSASRIGYGLDRSAARHEAMRTQADRAVQLAPESLDAQLAECDALITFEQNIPGIIVQLQALAAKYPDRWRPMDLLSECYRLEGKIDKSLAANERALQLSPGNPLLNANRMSLLGLAGRWPEAEISIPVMLRVRTSARLLSHDVSVKLVWSGEVAAAEAAVRSWPAWFLLEDRGVGHAALAALWNRDPGRALEVVQKFPRDYLRDYLFTGPSAVLSAWAYEQAGNPEAARADWRIVQQVAERELRAAPDDPFALHWKAWALARLGDTPAAASILQQLLERDASLRSMGQILGRLGGLALTVGRTNLALVQIARNPPGARAITRTILRLNPIFDPLRGDPRFQAVIDAAPGPKKKPEDGMTGSVAPDEKSVAVLAFANLSDDKENEYFSDGISEELLNVLAKVPGLKVSARTSAFYFKGKQVPMAEIAKQLGVAYVVEGSVRKSGDRVRITVQLIKASDGFHVWSDTFTRELKDIFAVQDEIAGLVAKNLEAKLGATTRSVVVDTRAFELYMQGRAAWNRRNAEGFDRAEGLLRQALEIAPDFARAHTALADVWMIRAISDSKLSRYGQRASPVIPPIETEAQRALELDPESAEAHATLGFLRQLQHRPEESLHLLHRSVELNPNYATGHHWLAGILAYQSRFDECVAEYRRAVEVDPLSHRILDNFGWTLAMLGRVPEALALFDRALALQPDDAQALAHKAITLARLGRRDEARALAAKVTGTFFQSAVLSATGEKAEIEAALRTADRPDRYQLLTSLGRYDEALNDFHPDDVVLEDAQDCFFDPNLVPYHKDPRFQKLITELG